MGVLQLTFLSLVILANLVPAVARPVQAQNVAGEQAETCPFPRGWQPTEDLPRILAEHRDWVARWTDNHFSQEWLAGHPEGRANLCNADLWRAQLNQADLWRAEFNKSDLYQVQLNQADLSGAKLNQADIRLAQLNQADLRRAELNQADIRWAQLNQADLREAQLTEAKLSEAQLEQADLSGAQLTEAKLINSSLKDTHLARVNLTGATYAPASPPPDAYVAGIQGLQTVIFPKGQETGLVQLRELLQKAGLRDLEREATYAIERGKTWHLLDLFDHWLSDRSASYQTSQPDERQRQDDEAVVKDVMKKVVGFDSLGLGQAILDHPQVIKSVFHHPGAVGEGLFRLVAFDLTTAYGLHPARALWIIAGFWAVLTLVYVWPIRFPPQRSGPASHPSGSIYQVWLTDRIEHAWDPEFHSDHVEIRNASKGERLKGEWRFAFRYTAYFSLLSAFSIGFREFNVGTWIARLQAREYALRATGWVCIVSGLQSLLSVYLVAIWALTYFGRPFQ
jgi:Pentapeptide repeats (8 copies)